MLFPSTIHHRTFLSRMSLCISLCRTMGLLFWGCAIAASTSFAQDVPTLRVQSQLVVLDVVVTDKSGKVVTNLTQDDFEVTENGVLQNIRDFDSPRRIESIPVTAPRDRFGRENWGDTPLTMIVIDAMNTPFEETAYSRQQVDKYLHSQPSLLNQPTILLWLNDSGIHPVTGFWRDRDALIASLDAHKASLPDKLARGAAVEQLSASLSAIQQLALFSRANKGDKQIIWVGRSFPGIDGTVLDKKQLDFMHKAINSTIDLLMKSRAIIYVIDPILNTAPPPPTANNVGGPNTIAANFNAKDPFETGFNFMSFVEQTGGRYFYGRNDMNNEIEEGIDQGTHAYTLTYVPSDPRQDSEYRKIDIHLKPAGLFLQAKHGYYSANPMETTPSVADLKFDLHEALVSGMTYNGVGLRVQHCQLSPQAIATCQIAVDNYSLTELPGPDDTQRASIVAVIAALDKNSKLITNNVSHFMLKLPDQPAAVSYTQLPLHLAVPPNTQTLRIAIRDVSGRIGTTELAPSEIKH